MLFGGRSGHAEEKSQLVLWSGYQDAEREEAFMKLRAQGGCVLHSATGTPDTWLGHFLNKADVQVLKACSWKWTQPFWDGASRMFAGRWAARHHQVTIAMGYHSNVGASYKTIFQTVFYKFELKAVAQSARKGLKVSILFTHEHMKLDHLHTSTAITYERARLLSPDQAHFHNDTEWRYGRCLKSQLGSCEADVVFEPDRSEAWVSLGKMYYDGTGVKQNQKKAWELFRKAAKDARPSPMATFNMGKMYARGEIVKRNVSKALELYTELYHMTGKLDAMAEEAKVKAMVELGNMYCYGEGAQRNLTKARELYQQAADLGDAVAKCNLGMMYANGEGVHRNLTKTLELYLYPPWELFFYFCLYETQEDVRILVLLRF